MSKTLRLDEQVHKDLEELRAKRETFSQAIARLISLYKELARLVWSHTGERPQTPGQGG